MHKSLRQISGLTAKRDAQNIKRIFINLHSRILINAMLLDSDIQVKLCFKASEFKFEKQSKSFYILKITKSETLLIFVLTEQ